MAYTEVKKVKENLYYYRVRTKRIGNTFKKKRIYLGKGLSKDELNAKITEADARLNMKEPNKELEKFIPIIKKVLRKYKVKKAGIFGSFVKGEAKKDSDIDILILPPKGIGFGFVGIEMDLEEALKKKVDLVSYNGLSPYLKDEILKSEVRII